MRSITAPIRPNDHGDAVANLHEALRRLGLTGVLGQPPGVQEVHDHVYGPVTRQAIARFQAQFNVAVSSEDERGIVTEATAEMFNRVLVQREVLWRVFGRVTTGGQPLPDQVVVAFDTAFADAAPALGEVPTGPDGAYTILYDHLAYVGPGIEHPKEVLDLVVQVRNRQGQPLESSQPVHSPPPQQRIDIEVPGSIESRLVRGQVRDRDGTAVAGVTVRAWNTRANERLLGASAPTQPDGRYEIAYGANLFDPREAVVDLRLRAFNERDEPLAESTVPKARAIETVDLTVATAPPDTRPFAVRGRVFSNERAGVGGLRVEIVDKNVGNDVHLVDAITDGDGAYASTFPASAFSARGKAHPDLQARAFAGPTLLGASVVRYNATPEEVLDVVLSATTSSALPSEHESLTAALSPHFQGNLRDLQETDERQDVTYLANKTGWDARAVALAALADQFSAGTKDAAGGGIEPHYFYALFRAGLPANDDALSRVDSRTLKAVWTKAAEQGVMARPSDDEMERAAERYRALNVQRLLTGPAQVGVSPLRDMLAVSHLDDGQQQRFAELYAAHRNDAAALWTSVAEAFGPDMVKRLQVDGKLGFLTINNAALMQKIHAAAGENGITDTLQLAQQGYYRASKWDALLGADTPIPNEIPGDAQVKRANYAQYLAAQIRLGYPTAAVADMVGSGAVPVAVAGQVHDFLTAHQGKFEIGVQPVQQYLKVNNVQVDAATVTEVKRLQRVYQMTASDEAMAGLLTRGIDAAHQVVRYDRDTFVQSFEAALGGVDGAALTYDRSVQIHNTVLNVALAYLNARTASAIGVHSPPSVVDPAPANADDVLAYATLEGLFGSMDFCACDHCRSILSPAAYLVDLLLFIDRPDLGNGNPQAVLLNRRPDIQHLPLTCENTNTALPYIDVVNETLEYFIANNTQKLSLKDYLGHDTDGVASEDLLASPQFVMDSAYATLRDERFPAPLPFHKALENLRRYFDKLDVPLPSAMERLRMTDDLERGASPYGWRDVLMEHLLLSRGEYEILTDVGAVPLWKMYGFPNGTADADVLAGLSNIKAYSRRLGITYEELVCIVQSSFVNPNSDLIPRLERLGVPFATLKALKDGTITDAAFDALLPTGAAAPDPSQYPPDIKAWVKSDANHARIMGLITLTIPATPWAATKACAVGDCVRPTAPPATSTLYYRCTTAGTSGAAEPTWPTTPGAAQNDGTVVWMCADTSSCQSFDDLAFRYADPAKIAQSLSGTDFVRLLRFIRLWRKLGWTIDQTDAAICALYPSGVGDLDAGFRTLLPRLGIARRVMRELGLSKKQDVLALLACFAPIGTHDAVVWVANDEGGLSQRAVPSLYRQMFLNPALLAQDPVFDDDGYGGFLTDASQTLLLRDGVRKTMVAGRITVGDVLTTTINGMAIPYKVVAGDTSVTILATSIASTINAITTVDVGTGLPLNQVVKASSVAGVITVEAIKPAASFTAACSVSPNATETYTTLDHESALRAAFNLTSEEFRRITEDLKFDATTPLDLANVSAIFRRGCLARKLKISVRELLALIRFAGLDPFTLSNPTDPPIAGLIALARAMKDRSLKSAAALYLIWNQDFSGKSAPDPAQVDELARTLRGEFAAIDDQFAVIEDGSGDDAARDRVGLVYGQETADALFALLDDTNVVDVSYTHTANTLGDTITTADAHLAYDAFRHRLSHTGPMSTATRDGLKAIGGVTDAFKNAVDALFDRGEQIKGLFFTRHPELKTPYDLAAAAPPADRHGKFFGEFQPQLAERRKRQQALQRLSAGAGVDLPFTQALLDPPSKPYPLHGVTDAGKPALDDVLGLGTPGLEARFYFRDTATGTVDQPAAVVASIDYAAGGSNPLPNPGNAVSGIWSGRIETSEAGFYNFVVEADSGSTVTLTLDAQPRALQRDGSVWRNTDALELKAGTLYDIELKVEKVKDVLRLEWETPKRAREAIPPRYLYPPTILAPFGDTYVRFLKTASLATVLDLTAGEMTYFAARSEYQIAGDGWLNSLSVTGDPALATAAGFLEPFQALLDFSRIKAGIAPGDERLLKVLTDPSDATRAADGLLYTLTRWDPSSVDAILSHFGKVKASDGTADHDALASPQTFVRVHDAFELVCKTGVSAAALIAATTNEPTADTVRDLQAALRARYDAASWRDVVRPINDEMRSQQRDALVSYVLHQMRSHPESAHIDTADKLFEYFLMDVQMDPCMQTSRIRHALSSVQLFIERCPMNLEPDVSPAAIDAKQWAWMKRYRVWEANRKVYLFPENWLEPELRDDKSPFFKEIESELLQTDITEDSATTAMLNYLSKLEEVAKLEQCGMYYVPADPVKHTGEKVHVVARTAGAHRKYYYRRYEFGYWTPWEHIKLDIEDNPVVPFVWKNAGGNDRLLLFWLRILKPSVMEPGALPASPGPTNADGEKALAEVKLSEVKTSAKEDAKSNTTMPVYAVLCWSEYYNGKWQPTKTSDVNRPALLGSYPQVGSGGFDRSGVQLAPLDEDGAVRILLLGNVFSSFLLHNTHSAPLRNEDAAFDVIAFFKSYTGRATRSMSTSGDALTLSYSTSWSFLKPPDISHDVLTRVLHGDRTTEPLHSVDDWWEAPFFYEDARHVFYVTTTAQPAVWVSDYAKYGAVKDWDFTTDISPLVTEAGKKSEVKPRPWGDGGPIGPNWGVVDPVPMRQFITEDAYIRRGLGTAGRISFGDRQIGPAGAIGKIGAGP